MTGLPQDGVRVSQLAAGTRTLAQATSPAPRLSMILPTYNSHRNAELHQVLDSVLGQSFDFELVAVDDASDDDTLDILMDAARQDGRVTVLSHEYNVGLPAISVWEAYLQTRGETLGFVFHDTVFVPGALRAGIDQLDRHGGWALFSAVEWSIRDDRTGTVYRNQLGPHPQDFPLLTYTNMIGNSGVLLRRRAIERVGLYDPHVLLSRLCDWDLWRRTVCEVPVDTADWVSSIESGITRKTSLGHSYPLFSRPVRQLLRMDRRDRLMPSSLGDRNILESAPGTTHQYARAMEHLFDRHWTRGWSHLLGTRATSTTPAAACVPAPAPARTVVVGTPEDPAPFIFSSSSDSGNVETGVYTNRPDTVLTPLGSVACTILSRATGGDDVEHFMRLCRRAGIPVAALWDDNPLLLPSFGRTRGFDRFHSLASLRDFAARLDHLVVTSDDFADWVIGSRIHPDPLVWQPSLSARLLAMSAELTVEDDPALRVAVPGGTFRLDGREKSDLLAAISSDIAPVTWLVREHEVSGDALRRLPTVGLPFTGHYPQFVLTWAAARPSLTLHLPGPTANSSFKLPTLLLAATYWGTPLVFPDEPAWRAVPSTDVTRRCRNASEYRAAVIELARAPRSRRDVRAELRAIADTVFPEERFQETLAALSGGASPEPRRTAATGWPVRVRT